MSSGARLRATAARVITEVVVGRRSLDAALSKYEGELQIGEAGSARAQLRAICYGSLRFYPRLEIWLNQLLSRPLRKRDALVKSLLIAAIHQLDAMRIAPHAVVAETVSATRVLGQARASGLANAVLRRFQREVARLRDDAGKPDAGVELQYAHPAWLAEAFAQSWPESWRELLLANNEHPPFWVRLNTRRLSRTDFEAQLAATGATVVSAAPGLDSALLLDRPLDVNVLPGFSSGAVSVQDAAAQFAAPLLGAHSGHRVLDACAAPGGKTGHILESADDIELVALDSDVHRLKRVSETAQRLGVHVEVKTGRAENPAQWWDERPFDRILLDAPCSATGVIRRHPDIKLLRRRSDIEVLAAGQLQMLKKLWPLLRPGGRFVYATCSVLREENRELVAAFLASAPDARALPAKLLNPVARETGPGHQIATGDGGLDGFFYACMEKAS